MVCGSDRYDYKPRRQTINILDADYADDAETSLYSCWIKFTVHGKRVNE